MSRVSRTLLALAAIVAVYGVLYAPARRFEFVWADGDAIRDSRVFDLPLGRELRTTEHARMDPSLMELHGIVLTHEAWRPLLILSHGFDIAHFGRVPGPMHVHNIVLGALGILAAFWLAARLFGATTPALAVAALFAWHPLHVEPICFISARGDPLSGLFALVAAALVVEMAPVGSTSRSRRSKMALAAAAGVFMLLSLFTKEANVLAPLALAGFALATGRLRAWAVGLAALATAVVVYAIARALCIATGPAATHGERLARAAGALPAIVLEYARSFLLPFDLSISRPLNLPVAVGWAALAVVVVVVALALRRAPPSWSAPLRLAAAGVAWAGLTIAPAAVAVFSEAAVADRYAYLALFGFAMALVAVGTRIAARSRAAAWAAGSLMAIMCVFVTAREIPAWASSGALYAHAAAVEPDSATAHSRVGSWLAERGAWSEAVVEFEKSAVLPGAGDRVHDNLGVAYLNAGRLPEAEAMLRRAVDESHGTSYRAFYNLGTVQRLRGDVAGACASYRRALAVSSDYARARADLQRYCR